MHSPGARNRSPASGVPVAGGHRHAVRCVHRRTGGPTRPHSPSVGLAPAVADPLRIQRLRPVPHPRPRRVASVTAMLGAAGNNGPALQIAEIGW
jgi:hypothetical protein